MLIGEVVSQWSTDLETGQTAPELYVLFGHLAKIEDITQESVSTVTNDPNFVVNKVTADPATWLLIDAEPKTEVLYYG